MPYQSNDVIFHKDLHLQVINRRDLKTDHEILFGWKALPKTVAKSYNLYQSSNVDGPFVLFKSGIPNQKSVEPGFKGKVLYRVLDSQIPIAIGTDHYFKLTYVDNSNVESDITLAFPKTVHPPQIENTDHGSDTDNNSFNWCWDEVNHRWVKARKLTSSEYININLGTTEQVVTFNQDVCLLEIQNNDSTADILVNLNGDSIATYGGMRIEPGQYYTAGRCVCGATGITLVSSAPDTSVTIVGHF